MRIPSFRLPVSTALLVVGLVAVFPAIAPAIYLASYLPPAGAAYVAEEVRIRTPGGPSLAGTLTLPGRGVLRDGRPLRYPRCC